MSQTKTFIILAAVCLAAITASSAPTDSEVSTTPMSSTEAQPSTTLATKTDTTTVSTSATKSDATTTPTPGTKSDTTTTTPSPSANEISSMAVSSAQDPSHLSNTSFTCFNRKVGYYADIDSSCKVYHFCMLGDYNGQEVYQRISYLCLNETVFDQQVLDCVEPPKITSPCQDSANYYEESNSILRKAIIGNNATAVKDITV